MVPLSDKTRWFVWGSTLAVVAGARAFSIGAEGWREVNPVDVGWDGTPLSEAEARAGFARRIAKFGEPPIAGAHAGSSVARTAAQ